jgi:hypothetical protein
MKWGLVDRLDTFLHIVNNLQILNSLSNATNTTFDELPCAIFITFSRGRRDRRKRQPCHFRRHFQITTQKHVLANEKLHSTQLTTPFVCTQNIIDQILALNKKHSRKTQNCMTNCIYFGMITTVLMVAYATRKRKTIIVSTTILRPAEIGRF